MSQDKCIDRSYPLHNFTVDGSTIKLDDFELKGVYSYSLTETFAELPKLTITLTLENEISVQGKRPLGTNSYPV